MHLPQIRRELRLLIAAVGHILMRRSHLPPRLDGAAGCRFHQGAGHSAPLTAHLLIEHQTPQFPLELGDLVRLGCGNGGQQPLRRIQRPVRIVAGEALLMRSLVAPIPQFGNDAALGVV